MTENFAQFLAGTRAVAFGQFKLKSGIESDIFFNFGNIASGRELDSLGRYFANFVIERNLCNVDALFGPAYKGISLAVSTSIALWRDHRVDLPVAYNRKFEKMHGEGGDFIGKDLTKVSTVLVIDDVITDGLTKYETIEMLRQFPGLKISKFVIGVDRQDVDQMGRPWLQKFVADTGIDVVAMTTKEEVMKFKPGTARAPA